MSGAIAAVCAWAGTCKAASSSERAESWNVVRDIEFSTVVSLHTTEALFGMQCLYVTVRMCVFVNFCNAANRFHSAFHCAISSVARNVRGNQSGVNGHAAVKTRVSR